MNDERDRKSEINEALMQALGFTDDDLIANRRGELSVTQLEKLGRSRDSTARRARVSVLVAVGAVIVAVWLIADKGDPALIWVGGVFVLILTVVMWTAVRTMNPVKEFDEDLETGRVQLICGKVRRIVEPQGRYSKSYFIAIEDRRFKFTDTIITLFNEYDVYCFYLAPRTQELLSVEMAEDVPVSWKGKVEKLVVFKGSFQ